MKSPVPEGPSDIGVTLNVYTHLGLEDAATEMARMEAVEEARREGEDFRKAGNRENIQDGLNRIMGLTNGGGPHFFCGFAEMSDTTDTFVQMRLFPIYRV